MLVREVKSPAPRESTLVAGILIGMILSAVAAIGVELLELRSESTRKPAPIVATRSGGANNVDNFSTSVPYEPFAFDFTREPIVSNLIVDILLGIARMVDPTHPRASLSIHIDASSAASASCEHTDWCFEINELRVCASPRPCSAELFCPGLAASTRTTTRSAK